MTSLKEYQRGIIAFCLVVSLALPPSLVLSVGMSFVDAPLAYAAGEVPVPAPAGESSGAEQSFDPASVGSEGSSGSSTTTSGGNIDYGPGGYVVDGALSAASGSDSNYSSDGSNYSSDGSSYSSDGSNYSSDGSNYSSEGSNYSSDGSNYSSDGSNYSSDGSNYSSTGSNYSVDGGVYLTGGSSYSSEGSNYSSDGSSYSSGENSSNYSDTSSSNSSVGTVTPPAPVSTVSAVQNYIPLTPVVTISSGSLRTVPRLYAETDPSTGLALYNSSCSASGLCQSVTFVRDSSGTIQSIIYTSDFGTLAHHEYVYTDLQPGAAHTLLSQGMAMIGSDNFAYYAGRLSAINTYEATSDVYEHGRLVAHGALVSTLEFEYQPSGYLLSKTETTHAGGVFSSAVMTFYQDLSSLPTPGSNEALMEVRVFNAVPNQAKDNYVQNTVYNTRGEVTSERAASGDLINYDRSDPANVKVSYTSAATGETTYYVNCSLSVSTVTPTFPIAAISSTTYNRGTISYVQVNDSNGGWYRTSFGTSLTDVTRVDYSNGDSFVLSNPITTTVVLASGSVTQTTFTATVTRSGAAATFTGVRGLSVSPLNGVAIDQITGVLLPGGWYKTTTRIVYSFSAIEKISKTTYTYNDSVNRLDSSLEYRRMTETNILTNYDEQGRVRDRTYYDETSNKNGLGSPYRWEVMTYNGRGLLESTTAMLYGQRVIGSTVLAYDADGRLVKETITKPPNPSELYSLPLVTTTRFTVYDATTGNVSKIVTCEGAMNDDAVPEDYFRNPVVVPSTVPPRTYWAAVNFQVEFFDANGKNQGVASFTQNSTQFVPNVGIQMNEYTIYSPTAVPGTSWTQIEEKTYMAVGRPVVPSLAVVQLGNPGSDVPQNLVTKIYNERGQLMKIMGAPNLRAAGPAVNTTTFYVYNPDGSLAKTSAFEGSVTSVTAPESTTGLLLVDHYEMGSLKTSDRYVAGAKDNITFYVETQLYEAGGKNVPFESCNIRLAGQGGRTSDILTEYFYAVSGSNGTAGNTKFSAVSTCMVIYNTFNTSPNRPNPWLATNGGTGYMDYALNGNINAFTLGERTSLQNDFVADTLTNRSHLMELLDGETPTSGQPYFVKLYEPQIEGGSVNGNYLHTNGNFFIAVQGSNPNYSNGYILPTRTQIMTPGANVISWLKSGPDGGTTPISYTLVVNSNLNPGVYSVPMGLTNLFTYTARGTLPGEFLIRTIAQYIP